MTAEMLAVERAWREKVRALVMTLARTPNDMLGVRVLLDEHKPSRVARESGVPLHVVTAAAARLRRRLAGTLDARSLLDER